MRKRISRALLMLVVLQPIGLFARSAKAEALEVGAQVVDTRGVPIEGVAVELHRPLPYFEQSLSVVDNRQPLPLERTTSDGEGRFRVAVPGPGMWQLRLFARGFVTGELRLEPLLESQDFLPVVLEQAHSCDVTVVEANGQPVVSARVELRMERFPRSDSSRSRSYDLEVTTRTDERGRATLGCAAEGQALLVTSAGFLTARVAAVAGRSRVVLERGPATRVLDVREPDGRAARNVVAFLDAGPSTRPLVYGVTDEVGRLAIPVRTSDRNRLWLLARSGAHAETEVTRGDEPLRVDLRAAVLYSGSVVDVESRLPVPGALVWFGDPAAAAGTQPDGTYSIQAMLPPGVRTELLAVQAAAQGYSLRNVGRIRWADLGPRPVPPLGLVPLGRVDGQVVDTEGRPVVGAAVSLEGPNWERGERPSTGFTRSREDGRFVFTDATLEWMLRLTVRHAGYAASPVEIPPLAVDGPRRASITVRLAAGRHLAGTVVDEANRPVAGALLRLAASPETSPAIRMIGSERLPETWSDEEGRFELVDLAPGRYDLGVEAAGYAVTEISGIVLPEEEAVTEVGMLALSPGVELEGRVVDSDGAAVGGALVSLSRLGLLSLRRFGSGREVASLVAATTADGHFKFVGLVPEKAHTVDVECEGYVSQQVTGVRASGAPVVVELEPATSLRGVVVDSRGEPIEAARVLLQQQRRGTRGPTVGTDREGHFEVENLAADVWDLTAYHFRYPPAVRRGLRLDVGRQLEELRLVLPDGASVSGRVDDENGEPVPRARVTRRVDDLTLRTVGGRLVETGMDGQYRLEGLPPGKSTLTAALSGYPVIERDIELEAGENTLDFHLEPGLTITGTVVDDTTGGPLSGVTVQARQSTRGGRRDTTDQEGRFAVRGLEQGTYTVVGSKGGYVEQESQPIVVDHLVVSEIELRLRAGAAIVGRVVGRPSDQLMGLVVAASKTPTGSLTSRIVAPVDHEGRFRLAPVSSGTWYVTAGQSTSKVVTLDEDTREVSIELELGHGLELSGRVLLDDEPLVGASIRAVLANAGDGAVTRSDQTGRFVLNDLETGAYQLIVTAPDGNVAHEEALELASHREVEVELRSARITGRVLDRTSRAPIPAASVQLLAVALERGASGSNRPWRADRDGAFEARVMAGLYRVIARAEGYTAKELQIDTFDGDLDVEIELDAASGGLRLHITRSDGAAPPRVRITALDHEGRVLFGNNYSGALDWVQLSELPEGRFTLILSEWEGGVAEVDVEMPRDTNETRTVVLPSTGSLAFRVSDLVEEATGAVGQLIDARGRLYRRPDGLQVIDRWRLVEGGFVLSYVPEGPWILRVVADDGREWSRSVEIEAGRQTRIELEGTTAER